MTHIYFRILEPFLQVLVDGFVGHLADQGKIRDTDFLLLGGLKDGLCGKSTPRGLLGAAGILLAPRALAHSLRGLYGGSVSACALSQRVWSIPP
jgi:hypothetical protein